MRGFGKYGVASKQARTVDGITFDSKGEAHRWLELKTLERAHKIRNLRRQIPFPLIMANGRPIVTPTGRAMKYVADFAYEEFVNSEWREKFEDFKGMDTKESQIKRAVVEALYGIKIEITKAR